MVRQVLSQHGVNLKLKPLFAGSSSNVYKTVLLGKAQAGAVLDIDFDTQPPEVQEQLRPLVRTHKMAPHPIAAHPRVPAQLQRAVTAAVLRMGANATYRALLQSVQLANPVKADYARDYQPLEKMDYGALTRGF